MINGIGAVVDLATGATGVSVPTFEATQYNPTPWDADLVIFAAVEPQVPTDTGEAAQLDFNARGKEYLNGITISNAEFSSAYSQLVRLELKEATPWQLRLTGSSQIAVRVRLNLYFFHANEDGTPTPEPTLFV